MLKMIEFGLLAVTLLIVFGLAANKPSSTDVDAENNEPLEKPR